DSPGHRVLYFLGQFGVSLADRRRRLAQRLAAPEAGDGEEGRNSLHRLIEGGLRGSTESRRTISISWVCAGLVGSRNSSTGCASASLLKRTSSKIRCRRFSGNSDGGLVTRRCQSSPSPNKWLSSVAVS